MVYTDFGSIVDMERGIDADVKSRTTRHSLAVLKINLEVWKISPLV